MSSEDNKMIDKLAEQLQKYLESNKQLMEMISSEKASQEWSKNYHLIDHDYMIKWKNSFSFDNLKKSKNTLDKKDIHNFIKKNIQLEEIGKLNDQNLNYDKNNSSYVNSLKSYDIISNDVWKLFELKNENQKYDTNVSILKGNKKIIIRFDDNNYSVKYLRGDVQNLFGEFFLDFNKMGEELKKKILYEILENNIYKWMKKVKFQYNKKQFTINEYNVPIIITQKTNNYFDENITFKITKEMIKEGCNNISLSDSSFSFPLISSLNFSFSSSEISNFFNDIENFIIIQKYGQTSNICAVMRCLSMIEPLADYFMSNINAKKIFSKFQSFTLLNLTRQYFLALWSNEKEPYGPKDFLLNLKKKRNYQTSEEQDPIDFLNIIFDYINRKLNKLDYDLNYNFNDIEKNLVEKSYAKDLKSIIDKNNSIISKLFFGIIKEEYKCNNCNKNVKNISEFKIIDIDYIDIIKQFKEIDKSFDATDIDDFLIYYFLKKKIDNNNQLSKKCPLCQKDAKIISREILEYPSYLIIRLNRGKFDGEKGFIDNIDIHDVKIKFDKILYIKNYRSSQIKDKENNNIKYELISMVNYYNSGETKEFISICRSPLVQNIKSAWISFACN